MIETYWALTRRIAIPRTRQAGQDVNHGWHVAAVGHDRAHVPPDAIRVGHPTAGEPGYVRPPGESITGGAAGLAGAHPGSLPSLTALSMTSVTFAAISSACSSSRLRCRAPCSAHLTAAICFRWACGQVVSSRLPLTNRWTTAR